jgi:integration host factor subunit beta
VLEFLSHLNGNGVHMNKTELILELARQEDLTKTDAQRVVELIFDEMANSLADGGRVEIRGLCSFKVKQYDGYAGRNPKTGQAVNVAPKKLPFFKPGTDLKARIDK